MATSDELRDRLDQESQDDQEKRDRIQAAIDARAHSEEYGNDAREAEQAAMDAEAAIDGDSNG